MGTVRATHRFDRGFLCLPTPAASLFCRSPAKKVAHAGSRSFAHFDLAASASFFAFAASFSASIALVSIGLALNAR